MLETVIKHELWKTLTRADGAAFGSLGEFLTAYFPHGAGCGQDRNSLTYAQVMELCKDFPSVLDKLAENAPKGKPGRKRDGEENHFVRSGLRRERYTLPVLQTRLAQEHPEIWSDFLAGRYRSVRAAAEAAGLVKNANDPLSRLKSNWKKASAAERRAFMAFIENDE